MDVQKSDNRQKFPEPRAWALNWGDFAPSTPPEASPTESLIGSNGSCRKFPAPNSWALNWEGGCLDAEQDMQRGKGMA